MATAGAGALAAGVLLMAGSASHSAAAHSAWTVAPEHPDVDRYLEAVDAVSPSDVWAVGTRIPRGFLSRDSFIQHWDGTRWSTVDSGQHHARVDLSSVAAVGTDDVWAVGTRTTHEAAVRTLTMHWDGSSWRRVPSPNLSGDYERDELWSVSGTASDDVWAVGFYELAPSQRPLIEHWDGSTWASVTAPIHGPVDQLTAVDALSETDAWAVGDTHRNGVGRTFVVHWDGARWQHVPSPNRRGHDSALLGVTALSPTDVWAVGYFYRGDGLSRQLPLAEHWDGSGWHVVKTPHPPGVQQDTSLTSVSGDSPDDVWAVGNPQTLMHWDGQSWSLVDAPDGGQALGGVTTLSDTDAWAVGTMAGPARHESRLHWDGSSWSRS